MEKKQFQTESKKLLDMMINSVYTHKEIFLREIISNASDAIDKRHFLSLTDQKYSLKSGSFEIFIAVDKDKRTITISDNGIGMDKEELENNLGTIAKSGSFDFKQDDEAKGKTDIIGQFGVGFYSAFMVADSIIVNTKKVDSDKAYTWQSSGVDGFTIDETNKDDIGTQIILHLRADNDDEKYSEYLEEFRIRNLISKYSNYIKYPIKMEVTKSRLKEGSKDEYEDYKEVEVLNSMTPLWNKSPKDIKKEEYSSFYKEKFYDFEDPLHTIHFSSDGMPSFKALMFIPSRAPFDYYSKTFEKGLELYSNGVLIMDKCADLLPDYFSFVKGVVDSPDLSLNISREMLQHNKQLKVIAGGLEKKIKNELAKLLESDRTSYEKFYDAFGLQLKYGIYSSYGMNNETLKDLIMFISSYEEKKVTLKEYVSRMKSDQKQIYYASGSSIDAVKMLPQAEAVKEKGFEVLYLTAEIDEFSIKALREYEGHEFLNVTDKSLDIDSKEDKEKLKEENEKSATVFDFMKKELGDKVDSIRFSSVLKNHPVCLSTEGNVSLEMENVLSSMPGGDNDVKAKAILEINLNHPIASKIKSLYETDKDKLAKYTKILYSQARLIGGMKIDNPSELSDLVCGLMAD